LSPGRPRFKAPDVAEKRLELKEQTETDRLPRVKEKRNYKRFELIPFLAILCCVGMLLFEGYFLFELYDRAVDSPDAAVSAVGIPEDAAEPDAVLSGNTNAVSVVLPPAEVPPPVRESAPAELDPAPVEAPSADLESEPVAAPAPPIVPNEPVPAVVPAD
jgi:hypothetical protein